MVKWHHTEPLCHKCQNHRWRPKCSCSRHCGLPLSQKHTHIHTRTCCSRASRWPDRSDLPSPAGCCDFTEALIRSSPCSKKYHITNSQSQMPAWKNNEENRWRSEEVKKWTWGSDEKNIPLMAKPEIQQLLKCLLTHSFLAQEIMIINIKNPQWRDTKDLTCFPCEKRQLTKKNCNYLCELFADV